MAPNSFIFRRKRHNLNEDAFDLLHLNSQDLWRTPLQERRAALRKLIELDPRSPIQFSDHDDCDGAVFIKAAVDLGLEGIESKRARSLNRGGPSKNWLKIKNMVEGEFILLGTEVDGIPGHCWHEMASWCLPVRLSSDHHHMLGPNGPVSFPRCRTRSPC